MKGVERLIAVVLCGLVVFVFLWPYSLLVVGWMGYRLFQSGRAVVRRNLR